MTALALKLPELRLPPAVREHWRASLALLTMLALWIFAGSSLFLHGNTSSFEVSGKAATAPAAAMRAAVASTAATRLKQIAPTDALAFNASIPVSNSANPAARPFILRGSEADRARATDCLTAAIYYEAATEPTDGQRAVAQVVLNRARHPAYPSTVCGVVFEGARRYTGCQFSFSCDGSLRRAPMASYWERARRVAEAALAGSVYAPVGWATHYHTNWIVPYWASSLTKAANVGTHIFYRWTGGWGRPPAFVNRHGVEPAIAWRGGFGQPSAAERLAAAQAGDRDAAAAEAAAGALPLVGSVDSFQRAVLRRYEPLQRDSANAVINERMRANGNLTNSQRWSLTGSDSQAQAPQQRPLGRWATAPDPGPAPAPVRPRTPAAAPAAAAPVPMVAPPPPADSGAASAAESVAASR